MTDINAVIAEIREASAKAEHGPWRAQPCEPASRYSDIKGDLDLGWGAHIARGVKNENAAHIAACCPANMAAVIAHIDALTRERDEARVARMYPATAHWEVEGFPNLDTLRADIERLTRERNDAWAFAALRDQRDADMQSLMAANNELLAGRDAAAEAMRARCERIVRYAGRSMETNTANAIANAIAALKVEAESAPDPRDAEITALREALDAAESWIERHQEDAHDGAEWAGLLTKIDCAMRASAARTAPCSTCGRGFREGATP